MISFQWGFEENGIIKLCCIVVEAMVGSSPFTTSESVLLMFFSVFSAKIFWLVGKGRLPFLRPFKSREPPFDITNGRARDGRLPKAWEHEPKDEKTLLRKFERVPVTFS